MIRSTRNGRTKNEKKQNIQSTRKNKGKINLQTRPYTVGQKEKKLQVRKQSKQTFTINLTDTLGEDDKM